MPEMEFAVCMKTGYSLILLSLHRVSCRYKLLRKKFPSLHFKHHIMHIGTKLSIHELIEINGVIMKVALLIILTFFSGNFLALTRLSSGNSAGRRGSLSSEIPS
jgi:hypothetical protein